MYECVSNPGGKLRRPKGLKKGFLLQLGTYGTEDGGDTDEAREESGRSSDKRSDSSSVADFDSNIFLDRLNFTNLFKRGPVNEELLVNQMGKRIQEYFLNESDNFMGMFAPSELPKRKVKKKREREREGRRPGRVQRVE